jgi:hypothetical protein
VDTVAKGTDTQRLGHSTLVGCGERSLLAEPVLGAQWQNRFEINPTYEYVGHHESSAG